MDTLRIAVIIPCFNVRSHILSVISQIGESIDRIIVVDDCCPESSGNLIKAQCNDPRVMVIFNKKNLGVGGAVIQGYQEAINLGMDIAIKIDGDGQMDPALIPLFIKPLIDGAADYTKGNRFFNLDALSAMPIKRLYGNALLSFITKFSSGYWNIFDPTNGYTAIQVSILKQLPLTKISNRYFFESDMLFRLNTLQAVVLDIPIDAKYGSEKSNMKISKIIPEFMHKNITNFLKRIFYNYYLRDMSIASVELPLGFILFIFGLVYGGIGWLKAVDTGLPTATGTIMLSALPILMGLQLILAFIAYDISATPKIPRHKFYKK